MNNIALIEDFVAAWNANDPDGLCAFLHDDIRYHSIPMAPIQGRASCEAHLRSIPFDAVDCRILNIAENGDVVLIERLDGFVVQGHRVDVRAMAIYKICDGKILEFREYFDLQELTSQMPRPPAS